MVLIDEGSPFSERPTHAEVSVAALKQNFETLKSISNPAKVMAVIKANAYGHGLVPCGKLYEEWGADFLGVAYLEEALALRKAGVETKILVFGGLLSSQVDKYIEHGIDITAPSVMKLKLIDQAAKAKGKKARVHLKIDTGLERLGVHHYSATELLDSAVAATHCDIVGIFSHFANVDPRDLSFTKLQLERFLETVSYFEKQARGSFLRHIASSGGILACKESHLDMVRPGVALYGIYPDKSFKNEISLSPTLALKSQVVYFKVVKKGNGVSYGLTWKASRDTRVATIPIGYGDGYSRRLSNKGAVLIGGKRYPIIGMICMDQLMVDLGPDGEAYNGDEVVLIGRQAKEEISIEQIADWEETNQYEVLVTLNQRIPRIYV